MARLIQTTIKTPLADDVLFGKLKNGGAVRVIVREEDGKQVLGFDYPEGRVTPRPEKVVSAAEKRPKRKPRPMVKRAPKGRDPGSNGTGGGGGVRTVPKVPLVKA
jgi:ATP-dependent Clp protease ATP-binding subunit ClpA